MATVLQFKQRPVKGTQKRGAPNVERFFCLACDTDLFKVYPTGVIHCANCGSLIRNMEVKV